MICKNSWKCVILKNISFFRETGVYSKLIFSGNTAYQLIAEVFLNDAFDKIFIMSALRTLSRKSILQNYVSFVQARNMAKGNPGDG